MKIVIVAAIGDNNVIGNNGKLPWHLHSDLRHFRALTLGKPLDRRTNIVVSRDLSLPVPGGVIATSFDAALAYARKDAQRRGTDEIMVIGGGAIFAAAMPQADRLEITHVHASPQGDAFFPPIDPAQWREVKRDTRAAAPGDDIAFAMATYVRR